MKIMRLFFCCLVALLFSCKKDATIAPPDLGYDYYPAKIRSYIVYDVDSISYVQVTGDTNSYKFQIKEVMDTLITDNQNRPTVKIIRYKKMYSATIPYSAMAWTLQDVWVANKTTTDVEVVEENVRYTKLAFPARQDLTWNGNAHDTIGAWDYKYASFDTPLTLNGNTFNKTAKVLQMFNDNAVYYQNYYEQYARGIGLISKHIEDYQFSQSGGFPHYGVIAGGIYYTMTINSYGTE